MTLDQTHRLDRIPILHAPQVLSLPAAPRLCTADLDPASESPPRVLRASLFESAYIHSAFLSFDCAYIQALTVTGYASERLGVT